MSVRSLELRRERANLISQARGLLDVAEGEDRELNQEESNQWDRLHDRADQLRVQYERLERQEQIESDLGDVDPEDPDNETRDDPPGEPAPIDDHRAQARARLAVLDSPGYRAAFNVAMRNGPQTLNGQHLAVIGDTHRALQADIDTAGGYLLAPVQMVENIIQAVDDMVYLRQWGTGHTITASGSMGAPSLDADPEDGNWTSEIGSVDEDTQMAFGARELVPDLLAKLIKVSRKALRLRPDLEAYVAQRLAYKFGVTWEKAALTGNGVKQPLGVFTASAHGISTGRDVATDNTTTAFTFDGLINAKFALKGQYWNRARWLFHRDAVKMAAKITDDNANYIWRESVRTGEPDTLLGRPLFMSEFAPNTFTASQYVGIIGDFSFFWYADSLLMEIQRLVELYAATSQVGFIGRLESDGMPVLEEAFARVQLAAS